MKKLFSLLTLVWTFAFAASAYDVPLDIDDVSRVLVSIEDDPVEGLHNGLNQISYPGGYLMIKAAPGCKLVSVVEHEEGFSDYDLPVYDDMCEFRPYEGVTYIVTSARAGDVRSATAHVWVDTPSKVILARGDGEERIELTAGDNDVPFDPASETRFSISPSDPDRPIYKVTHNDADVTAEGVVRLVMADGDKVRIQAEYPDEKHRVTLSVTGDYSDDRFVKGIYADGKYAGLDEAEGVLVQAGSRLTLKADTRSWEVLEFTVNGENAYFSDTWSMLVNGPVALAFKVRRYSTLRVNVVVDNPGHIKVYRGLHYNNDLIEPDADGKCTVDVRRDTPIVSFVPDADYHFTSATVDDYVYPEEDLKATFLQVGSLNEGETISVHTAPYKRDIPATVVINGDNALENFKLTRADGTAVEISAGRNEIYLDPWDNPFTFDCRGPVEPFVYLNHTEVSPTYPSSQMYSLSLVEGDLAEVYFGERPAGIDDIAADGADTRVLYNLQGVRVTSANPPAGLYVRSDGTKVLID